jgi:hypothetical protein
VPVPELEALKNAEIPVAFVDTGTMAPLASAESALLKLIVDTAGISPPDGKSVTNPPVLLKLGETTVTLTVTAFAPTGTPHTPWIWKLRVSLAVRAGPPSVPEALRVSTALHGSMLV